MPIVLPDKFGAYHWHLLTRAFQEDEVVIDMRPTTVVYPAGIVALTLAINHCCEEGVSTTVRVPLSDDVLNYLYRIDFFQSVPDQVAIPDDLKHLRGHARNPSDRFTEVLILEGEEPVDARAVFKSFLEQHYPDRWRGPFDVLNEVLLNARHHSQSPPDVKGNQFAFSALQVQTYEQRLELAFGDLGMGVLHSLNTSPNYSFDTSRTAIRAAVENGCSRLSHVRGHEERGGGLRRVKDLLNEMGGEFRLQSDTGRVHLSDGAVSYSSQSRSFPGTIVWCMIPNQELR